MKNNFLRKESNLSKTASVKKRTPSHMRVQSFDSYFEDVLARKNNQYTIIDSPHLNQRLSDISTLLNDKYISATSTPTTKIVKHLQRKKYTDLKLKIEKSISKFQQSKISSVKDLFEWKQILLTEFLNEFTLQIQKQCKEKGQILKYIWNSMFTMIEHISQQLSISLQKKERLELANSLKQHESYQKMIENQRQKQSVLNQRYDGYKVTISKLIYQLRFKRKEINKLYKNQKMLINKLNQYKNDNLDMQSNYIELMSSMRDLPPESVEQMLRAREEITKNRNTKLRIQGNKKTNRAEITQELRNDRTQQITELFEEIKVIANQQFDSPHLIGTLIEAAIENYGIFHDDSKETEQKLIEVRQSKATNDAGTQIDYNSFKSLHKTQQATQFSYIERLTADIINNKVTQTYCEFNKKKILIDRAVDTEKEVLRRNVELKFKLVKVYFENIWLKRQEPPNIVMSPISFDRNHKKHMSQLNLIRGKFFHKNTIKDSQHQSSLFDQNQRDQISSELPFQLEQRQPRATQKTYQAARRSNKLKKMTHVSQRSYVPLQLKKTDSKVQGQQPSVRKQSNRSQYTTPPSRFKEASVIQQLNVKNEGSAILRSQQKKKSGASPTSQYSKLRSDFVRSNFLSTKNCFNILIDQKKEQQITSFFTKKGQKKSNKLFQDLQEQDIEWSQTDLENQVIVETLNQIDNLPGSSASKKGSMNFIGRSQEHRVSMQFKYEDQNELLMKVCRSKYFKKGRKEREDKGKIFQFRDEYTSVKDNIEMIAKDVHQLMANKQQLLKKTANGKNLKNMYKILMMTFAKAYDYYNKQVTITNLVHPLFESLSLIYGAINTTEVYKKMISFIASISVMPENTILRFFLFFLGLDRTSPYSAHVTISQVYLCLALLENISIEGKVTLNIDSIYTDTSRVKEQLAAILSQQKIPSHLCANIKKRVEFQFENSATLRKSGEGQGHFKINIYNIILLIIKEVIKGKTKLRQSFTPIFEQCIGYKQTNKIPVELLELTLCMCHRKAQKKHSVDLLLNNLKRSTQFLKTQQFCSILFDYNLTCLQQLLQENNFIRHRWKVPQLFTSILKNQVQIVKEGKNISKFEFQLFIRLSETGHDKGTEAYCRIDAMKKLIFTKWYFEKVEDVIDQLLGSHLHYLGTISSQLYQ